MITLNSKHRALFENALERRQMDRPVEVAVIGAGWFGGGLIMELVRRGDMIPRVVISRRGSRAVNALLLAGIPKSKISMVDSAKTYKRACLQGHYIVSEDLELIHDLEDIDCVFEATGDTLAGAQSFMAAIKNGMHFITISSEMDSTIGCILNHLALKKGLIFSNSDGDQPGCLARIINEVKGMGFDITVAGNCKGFIDQHKMPRDIMPWVLKGHNPRMVTSFADGTKQGMELAVLADATGLLPDVRGMHGPTTTKETIIDDFRNCIKKEGIVDYCLGINGVDRGGGVFVIAKREGKTVNDDLRYLKKGDGPYYLFFRDYHLCYFEAPRSIHEVVREGKATIAGKFRSADVLTVAKQNLPRGTLLDGIGGANIYGVIDTASRIEEENLLPVGLAEYARLKEPVIRDTPISYDMVEFPEENLVLKLREQQDTLFDPDNRLESA